MRRVDDRIPSVARTDRRIMMKSIASPRQFSLRALLLFVLSTAVLLGVWRAIGTTVLLGLVFAVLSTVALVTLKGPWKRAYVISWSAVYVPFISMAVYTLRCVSCSHCKTTAWTVLPYAPALLPVEIARRGLDLPRLSDSIWFVVALFVSATIVIALAWLIRTRGRWWRVSGVVTTLAYCAYAALATLAMIRA
jgi:hypothetical protein